jgi:toxin ParE1/3/4
MEIRWSLPAAEDLERICERIELDNPEALDGLPGPFMKDVRLMDFPELGRASVRMPGRRELTFAPLPYIAVYEVRQHAIEISRVVHGAQDWG